MRRRVLRQDITSVMGQLCEEILLMHDRSKVEYLVYCHDMLDEQKLLTATMQVKTRIHLKKAIPFSVTGQGRASAITAIQLLEMLHQQKEAAAKSLVLCEDRVHAPHPRLFYGDYPWGDSAAAFLVGKEPGDFRVLRHDIRTWGFHNNNLHEMLKTEYQALQSSLYKKITAELESLCAPAEDKPVYTIVQHLSSSFQERLQHEFSKISFYHREYQPQCNLLTADPFYGLYELKKSGSLRKGDRVALIFAGPIGVVGTLLLECCTEK
jgi:3-oxoacyl-[acyl-carrier-protein] synthase III